MKSANLLSSTNLFVQKTQAALYTAIYFQWCTGSSWLFGWFLYWWNVVKCSIFLQTTYSHEIKCMFAML